ncbi:unnamed protein product [Spirodela intermedia]|uniref:Uncharacterized protein n=1 Tax=Spirodela intermedia TaxID=51605 RepID=A0A7I8KP00_SPIIN|nr:unnamed protein product [Spirodela intermedia]
MVSKISDAHFEALKADNKNLRKTREESTDLMYQLQQKILEALEKKEQLNLQPTSSYQPAQSKSRHKKPPLHPYQ